MTCPACRSENDMAYSALSHSFVCLEDACGFEVEMDPEEANAILAATDLVCA